MQQHHPDVLRAGDALIPGQMYRFSTDNGSQTARFVRSDNDHFYFQGATNQNNHVSAYPKTIIASMQPRLRLPGMDPPFVVIHNGGNRKSRKYSKCRKYSKKRH
jgi:hypothetical protein